MAIEKYEVTKLKARNKYLENRLNYFNEIIKYNKEVFRTLSYKNNTKVTNIMKKYHKKKKIFSNKLSYLAGLVDGEGYLKIEKSGTIRLIIGMTDKRTIKWIHDNFGGNFSDKTKLKSGKTFYVWTMNQGRELYWLLILLLPFLNNKRESLKNGLKKLIDKFNKMRWTLYPHHPKWK